MYTIVTNKEKKGGKGSLVALIRGTKSEYVIDKLKEISAGKRASVKEITLDLSSSMQKICKKAFPYALQVSDRFHVQKLMTEAVDQLRIGYRWEALRDENTKIKKAKSQKRKYVPEELNNGDTIRQLLFRSRKLLFKHSSKWSDSQKLRAQILFEKYPKIEQAYKLYLELIDIYNLRSSRCK